MTPRYVVYERVTPGHTYRELGSFIVFDTQEGRIESQWLEKEYADHVAESLNARPPVTLDQVKRLREVSGSGLMDCKDALRRTNGDFDAAVEYLRTKGFCTTNPEGSNL